MSDDYWDRRRKVCAAVRDRAKSTGIKSALQWKVEQAIYRLVNTDGIETDFQAEAAITRILQLDHAAIRSAIVVRSGSKSKQQIDAAFDRSPR